jgi:GNAT superfamily N-acetyltransferase
MAAGPGTAGSVRVAQVADARAIALVHVRSWQAAYRGLLPQGYLDGLDPGQRSGRWELALGEADWPRQGVLVAEQAGKVVGFARICPARDDDQDPATVGELGAIYLLPRAWGAGLGRELIRQAVLWVLDTNERARRFYAADGWRPDGAVKQEELDGAAMREVRYWRQLTPASTSLHQRAPTDPSRR